MNEAKELDEFFNVGVLITDSQRRRSLIQQKDDEYPHYPLAYSLFGGGIENQESALQAARRELDEEFDFDMSELKSMTMTELSFHQIDCPPRRYHFTLFECCLSSQDFERLASAPVLEGLRSVAVPFNQLLDRPWVWALETILPAALKSCSDSHERKGPPSQ